MQELIIAAMMTADYQQDQECCWCDGIADSAARRELWMLYWLPSLEHDWGLADKAPWLVWSGQIDFTDRPDWAPQWRIDHERMG